MGVLLFPKLTETITKNLTIREPLFPGKDAPPVLRNLIVSILTEEIKKEFTDIFSENCPKTQNQDANNNMRVITPAPLPRGNIAMVDDNRPLFYSAKEQRLIDYLEEHGPAKQAQIVKFFKEDVNPINDTTVKELLANLGHRRAITTGPDGYEVRR
ncbi:hypothetical protein UFOVP822_35 [uncultured Caudovirales phage]|uniref:Uncharacterized protein n=1 Tax=uncultured Caudovirales phage TaxID=2100421 RepID=A0A6J5PCP6_9CAUD|nr:hypothetical protein UFOVP822_35 [uncultured Caudovirales phage]